MRRGLGLDRRYERRADAADQRELEPARAQADVEPEDIELEAFHSARGDAEQSPEGDLVAAAARRRSEHRATQVILADGSRGKVDSQLRHGAGDPGGEGVRIRPGPDGVFVR